MISEIGKLTKFHNVTIWKINKLIEFFPTGKNQNVASKLVNFGNLLIFEMEKFQTFRYFMNLSIMEI